GLAAAGGAEQHRERAVGDAERHALHRLHTPRVDLAYVIECHRGHAYALPDSPPPCGEGLGVGGIPTIVLEYPPPCPPPQGGRERIHFSVSTRPFTNQRCISTTTATGGSMASMAVAITTFHSVSASAVTIIFLMPMTMVCMSSRVVIRIGHRYWVQP